MGDVKLGPRKQYVGFWGNRTGDRSSLNNWLWGDSGKRLLAGEPAILLIASRPFCAG